VGPLCYLPSSVPQTSKRIRNQMKLVFSNLPLASWWKHNSKKEKKTVYNLHVAINSDVTALSFFHMHIVDPKEIDRYRQTNFTIPPCDAQSSSDYCVCCFKLWHCACNFLYRTAFCAACFHIFVYPSFAVWGV
jgi:hypothetical protein